MSISNTFGLGGLGPDWQNGFWDLSNLPEEALKTAETAKKTPKPDAPWFGPDWDRFDGWEPKIKKTQNDIGSIISTATKGKKTTDEIIESILVADFGTVGGAGEAQELARKLLTKNSKGLNIIRKYALQSAVDGTRNKELARVLNRITSGITDNDNFIKETLENLGGEFVSGKWKFTATSVKPREVLTDLTDIFTNPKEGLEEFLKRGATHQFQPQIQNLRRQTLRERIINRPTTTRGFWASTADKSFGMVKNLCSRIPWLNDLVDNLRPSDIEIADNVKLQKASLKAYDAILSSGGIKTAGKTFLKKMGENLPLVAKAWKSSIRIPILGTILSLGFNGEFKANIGKALRGDIGAGANVFWEVGKNLAADFGTMAIVGGGITALGLSAVCPPLAVLAISMAGGTLLNGGIQAGLDGVKNTTINFASGFTGQQSQTQVASNTGSASPTSAPAVAPDFNQVMAGLPKGLQGDFRAATGGGELNVGV